MTRAGFDRDWIVALQEARLKNIRIGPLLITQCNPSWHPAEGSPALDAFYDFKGRRRFHRFDPVVGPSTMPVAATSDTQEDRDTFYNEEPIKTAEGADYHFSTGPVSSANLLPEFIQTSGGTYRGGADGVDGDGGITTYMGTHVWDFRETSSLLKIDRSTVDHAQSTAQKSEGGKFGKTRIVDGGLPSNRSTSGYNWSLAIDSVAVDSINLPEPVSFYDFADYHIAHVRGRNHSGAIQGTCTVKLDSALPQDFDTYIFFTNPDFLASTDFPAGNLNYLEVALETFVGGVSQGITPYYQNSIDRSGFIAGPGGFTAEPSEGTTPCEILYFPNEVGSPVVSEVEIAGTWKVGDVVRIGAVEWDSYDAPSLDAPPEVRMVTAAQDLGGSTLITFPAYTKPLSSFAIADHYIEVVPFRQSVEIAGVEPIDGGRSIDINFYTGNTTGAFAQQAISVDLSVSFFNQLRFWTLGQEADFDAWIAGFDASSSDPATPYDVTTNNSKQWSDLPASGEVEIIGIALKQDHPVVGDFDFSAVTAGNICTVRNFNLQPNDDNRHSDQFRKVINFNLNAPIEADPNGNGYPNGNPSAAGTSTNAVNAEYDLYRIENIVD